MTDTTMSLLGAFADAGARGLLLLAVAGVLSRVLRRSSAAIRHMVWSVALVGLLVLPVLQAVVPPLELPVGASIARALGGPDRVMASTASVDDAFSIAATIVTRSAESASTEGIGSVSSTGPNGGIRDMARQEASAFDASTPALPASSSEPIESAGGASPLRLSMSFWVIALWGTGVVVLLAPVVVGWVGVRRLASRSRPLNDPAVAALVSRLARRVGLRRAPRLLAGPHRTMPMTWGIVRPAIVVPPEASSWSAARFEAVLLHELAHVARRDCLTQLLAGVARAIHWFNPLVWVAARRLRVERELACDDVALRSGARASEYAQELLGLARAYRAPVATGMAAVAMARPNQLANRLLAVLDEERNRTRAGGRMAIGTVAAAVVLMLPLAAMVPAQVPVPPVPLQVPVPPVPAQAPRPAGAPPTAIGPHAAPAVLSPTSPVGAPLPPARVPASALQSPPRAPVQEMPAIAPPSALALSDPAVAAPVPPGWTIPVGPVAPRPLTGRSLAVARQDVTCAATQNGWRSVNHSSNDDRSTIRMSRPGCELDVRLEGEIEFDAEAIGIARLGRDARIRIEEDDGRRERRLDIVAGAGGAPSFEYRLNGREATFDAAAREWYQAVMLQLFRRIGFAAGERVAAMLRHGGVQAVLDELDHLSSDHVRARYITELVEQAELNESQYRTVVSVAMRSVQSDHYMAAILKTIAAEQPLTPRLLDDYVAASRQIGSDHYRTEVLRGVIGSGRLNTQQVTAVIESAGDMDSDHYRAQLLSGVADRYALEPAFRPAYLRAVESMDSDHYQSETLKRLLRRDDLSADEMAAVLRSTRMLDSDHYRTEILKLMGSGGLQTEAMRQAFFDAAAGIESDHYYREAMNVLVDDSRLSAALLTAVLDAATRELESDHYLSELLLRVLERHAVTGEARTAFLRAMDSLASRHYRGQVADALLRAERR